MNAYGMHMNVLDRAYVGPIKQSVIGLDVRL